jgi:hypothetical protein
MQYKCPFIIPLHYQLPIIEYAINFAKNKVIHGIPYCPHGDTASYIVENIMTYVFNEGCTPMFRGQPK